MTPTHTSTVEAPNSPATETLHGWRRRDFLVATALGGSTLLAVANAARAQAPAPRAEVVSGRRKRYAVVGVGGRSRFYLDAIWGRYAPHAELVGCCDVNRGRLELVNAEARERGAQPVPLYDAGDFDRMIRETRPDTVIVTTKDSAHDAYVVRAMQRGCDVITEKPMTTDEKKCRAILEAQRRTGRRCTVTFNYRYSPPRTQLKDLLMSGVIGEVLSVDFHWLLDTHHGADYFRRWHSQKVNSGGLMVHKATHHFDLVNWWLSAVPVSVFATGKREFYTPAMARRLGLQAPHERCLNCPEKERCAFHLDLAANPEFKRLFLDQEKHDGYFRDRCVFRPEIDIEDTMNVIVRYHTGATLSYSLNAFNAWEGYLVAFNGTQGRLEHKAEERMYLSGDGSVPGALKSEGTTTRIYPLRAPAYEVPVWAGEGGHGGGDDPLLEDLFSPAPPPDKYLRAADQRSGAWSILTGVAANQSIASGKAVEIASLVARMGMPEYPPMPSRNDPVPMPARS